MGEKLQEQKGNKTEKHKEKTIELGKDEKDSQKAKKKDKVVGKGGKSDIVVEALKTTGVEAKGNTRVRINDEKDSVDNLEGIKEKKKRHEEKKKEGVDGAPSEVDSEDGSRDELVKGKGYDKNRSDICAENGEEERAKKNKKKKKEKEDGDDGVKNIITNEQTLLTERNYVDGRIKEDGKLAVEKILDKVCDKLQKATENGEVAEANNDKGEGKSKKKKKEREDKNEEVEDGMKVDEGDESKNKKKRKRENVGEIKTNEESDKSKKKRKMKNASDESEGRIRTNEEGEKSQKKKEWERKNASVEREDEMETNEEGHRSKKKKRKMKNASDESEGRIRTNEEGEKSQKKKEWERKNTSVEREDEMETNEEGHRSKKKKRKSEKASNEVEGEMRISEEGEKSKKMKERKRESTSTVVDNEMETNGVEKSKKEKASKRKKESNEAEDKMKTDERDKSKKKKERKKENVSDADEEADKTNKKKERKKENVSDADEEADKSNKKKKRKKERKRENVSGNMEEETDELGKEDDGSKGKKNGSAEKQVSSGEAYKGKASTGEDIEATGTFENPTTQGKSKRVSFSDRVEVFSDDSPSGGESVSDEGKGLVQGKRFTPEEDELVKQAVLRYIEDHNLGEDGLDMVLNCVSHPEVKGCWTEIAAALPWRPRASVYYRGHVLFERDERRKWTAEEYDYIREFYKKYGADWKRMSIELKKHRFHCKDTWRRIKLANMKTGHWSQEEYQTLFDLVNMDLRMRALEERKSKHGMLRDNICWQSISDRLATRNNSTCCVKWYNQLTSPMVGQGLWADTDDYRLLDALISLDASCLEDVDWDNLLEHREGDICRKRWNQMVKHIGEYGLMSFSEQVETLAKRYSPDCIEAREEFDSKPILP